MLYSSMVINVCTGYHLWFLDAEPFFRWLLGIDCTHFLHLFFLKSISSSMEICNQEQQERRHTHTQQYTAHRSALPISINIIWISAAHSHDILGIEPRMASLSSRQLWRLQLRLLSWEDALVSHSPKANANGKSQCAEHCSIWDCWQKSVCLLEWLAHCVTSVSYIQELLLTVGENFSSVWCSCILSYHLTSLTKETWFFVTSLKLSLSGLPLCRLTLMWFQSCQWLEVRQHFQLSPRVKKNAPRLWLWSVVFLFGLVLHKFAKVPSSGSTST